MFILILFYDTRTWLRKNVRDLPSIKKIKSYLRFGEMINRPTHLRVHTYSFITLSLSSTILFVPMIIREREISCCQCFKTKEGLPWWCSG